MHSRNRRFGISIGRGATVAEAQEEAGGVVEGLYAAETACALARSVGVEMPIAEGAFQVLFSEESPLDVLKQLMLRAKRAEEEDIWQQ